MTNPERNAAQIDYWNGDVGRRWAALQDDLDRFLADVAAIAIAAAAPRPGERAIDIGCGCGATVLELAQAVGASGRVSGFDVSDVMLDVARRRIDKEGLTQAEVSLADAATHPFEPGAADLVFSRFGVMFFDAPAEAFANIKTALKPGGRVAFVCWRAAEENGWVTVPMATAKRYFDAGEDPPPDLYGPGPFAFAERERLRGILDQAGFSAVEIAPRDAMLHLAGPGDLNGAAALVTQVGPLSRALKSVGEGAREKARKAVATVLAAYDRPEGIGLPAAIWVVTARA